MCLVQGIQFYGAAAINTYLLEKGSMIRVVDLKSCSVINIKITITYLFII